MAERYDVIVIGVGAMGSSACFHLARRGVKVLGLEQFSIAHDRGSSHGQSRMIRMAYYEHPDYVPLLRRAYELWDELESLSGQKLLHRTGGIYLGPPDGGLIAGSLASARLHGLAHEVLSPGALAERFPPFHLAPGWIGVHEPAAGFLLPEAVVAAYAGLARQHGADIHGNEPVVQWTRAGESDDGDIRVRTGAGEYLARRLIVCGGAWSVALLPQLNTPLVVTRQVLGWVRPANPEPFALGRFPVWAAENPDGTLQYGFPVMPGEQTLKVAWHGAGRPTDADNLDRRTSGDDIATFLPALPHLLPGAAGPVAEMRVCMYTNSPDHHFIIDRLPSEPNVTVACGFSGHGFKFASVIGEVLADLATSGQTSRPAGFLSLARFR
ncbi:N-methyl-L-tryptophan oxidase [Humisphaera borealis]|uniref:N-methyl-L-tryptophan oxidase n=1 Tax=Humisphaera borealis TaxID=2807512 RepID=A0A7M2WUM0_9BACT|nr:N-methyl-L-tryptophan oxidase [Humisphaera borealis]QOV88501.1 N-methyl-L-tryptophan oxidase [Humisphaera borealis]